jgi:L-2,4-diaminobutyric acid acetyltransferase
MLETINTLKFIIRNVVLDDIREVYSLLTANRPYVGLNSRYTYFLLAKDFSDTCIVAECRGKIVGFSSGYMSPNRTDTFFSWEAVVHKDYRGNQLQRRMLLQQIKITRAKFFEGTVNPSNEASKRSFRELARLLETKCEESLLFSEEDFERDGHEAEILYRVGPISQRCLEKNLQEPIDRAEGFEKAIVMGVDGGDGSLGSCDGQEGMRVVKSEMKNKCFNSKVELACLEPYA